MIAGIGFCVVFRLMSLIGKGYMSYLIVSTKVHMTAIWTICQSTRWYHRFCLRHVASNFNQQIGNKNLKAMVMWASMENQLRKYQITRDRITQLSADGEKYLIDILVAKWTLAHYGGHRYVAMTTNLFERFNRILKSARNLPITALVELTYYRCVAYFADWYTKARTQRLLSMNSLQPMQRINSTNGKKRHQSI